MLERLPRWLNPNHPLHIRDTLRYKRLTAWQIGRWGCLPIFALLGLLPIIITIGVAGPNYFTFDSETVLLIFIFLSVSVSVVGSIVSTMTFLALAVGGALTVAPERERQTWTDLRLTTLTVPEIIAVKVVVVLRQVFPWLIIEWLIPLAVVLLILGALIHFAFDLISLTSELPPPAPITFPTITLIQWLDVGFALALSLVGIFSLVGATLLRPLYLVLVSTLASTFARSLNIAIGLSIGFHIVMGILQGVLLQQFTFGSLFIPLMFMGPNTLSPTLFGLQYTLPIFVSFWVQVGLAALSGWWAVRRASTFED